MRILLKVLSYVKTNLHVCMIILHFPCSTTFLKKEQWYPLTRKKKTNSKYLNEN